jgi:hypothetical protein
MKRRYIEEGEDENDEGDFVDFNERFKFLEILGDGGFSTGKKKSKIKKVYLALDIKNQNERVAIKKFKETIEPNKVVKELKNLIYLRERITKEQNNGYSKLIGAHRRKGEIFFILTYQPSIQFSVIQILLKKGNVKNNWRKWNKKIYEIFVHVIRNNPFARYDT